MAVRLEFETPSIPRRRIRSACSECRLMHKACDRKRPCERCVQLGISSRCIDPWEDPRLTSSSKPSASLIFTSGGVQQKIPISIPHPLVPAPGGASVSPFFGATPHHMAALAAQQQQQQQRAFTSPHQPLAPKPPGGGGPPSMSGNSSLPPLGASPNIQPANNAPQMMWQGVPPPPGNGYSMPQMPMSQYDQVQILGINSPRLSSSTPYYQGGPAVPLHDHHYTSPPIGQPLTQAPVVGPSSAAGKRTKLIRKSLDEGIGDPKGGGLPPPNDYFSHPITPRPKLGDVAVAVGRHPQSVANVHQRHPSGMMMTTATGAGVGNSGNGALGGDSNLSQLQSQQQTAQKQLTSGNQTGGEKDGSSTSNYEALLFLSAAAGHELTQQQTTPPVQGQPQLPPISLSSTGELLSAPNTTSSISSTPPMASVHTPQFSSKPQQQNPSSVPTATTHIFSNAIFSDIPSQLNALTPTSLPIKIQEDKTPPTLPHADDLHAQTPGDFSIPSPSYISSPFSNPFPDAFVWQDFVLGDSHLSSGANEHSADTADLANGSGVGSTTKLDPFAEISRCNETHSSQNTPRFSLDSTTSAISFYPFSTEYSTSFNCGLPALQDSSSNHASSSTPSSVAPPHHMGNGSSGGGGPRLSASSPFSRLALDSAESPYSIDFLVTSTNAEKSAMDHSRRHSQFGASTPTNHHDSFQDPSRPLSSTSQSSPAGFFSSNPQSPVAPNSTSSSAQPAFPPSSFTPSRNSNSSNHNQMPSVNNNTTTSTQNGNNNNNPANSQGTLLSLTSSRTTPSSSTFDFAQSPANVDQPPPAKRQRTSISSAASSTTTTTLPPTVTPTASASQASSASEDFVDEEKNRLLETIQNLTQQNAMLAKQVQTLQGANKRQEVHLGQVLENSKVLQGLLSGYEDRLAPSVLFKVVDFLSTVAMGNPKTLISIYDLSENKLMYLNQFATEFLGLRVEIAKHHIHNIIQFTHSDSAEEMKRMIASAASGDGMMSTMRSFIKLQSPKGDVFPGTMHCAVVKSEEGTPKLRVLAFLPQ